MGCGASKAAEVVPPPTTVVTGEQQPINIVNNYYGQLDGKDFNQHHQVVQRHLKDAASGLPLPQPPAQGREELLRRKEDMLERADQYAKKANKVAAATNSIEGFTNSQLMPPLQTVVKVVESNASEINSSKLRRKGGLKEVTNTHSPASRQGTPSLRRGTPSPKQDYQVPIIGEDQADELLQQHKRVIEQEQRLKEMQKYRQDMTLKEKLAKRREIMKKRKEAELRGERMSAAGEEVADKKMKLATTTTAGKQATLIPAGGVPMTTDASVVAMVPTEIEAAEDKYQSVTLTTAPQPAMPVADKELIYSHEENVELFKDLEDFAVNLKTLTSPDVTFADLMEKLLINELSDLEKVRILFHWITVQDLNAINFPQNIDLETPLGYLFSIKNDKKTYAELFSRLCSAAGLHAKTILGYLKGVGYTPDYIFQHPDVDKFRGSWNSVLVYGQWRLIDTHWGARHVLEDDEKTEESWETHYKYEEHYFLTDPDQLISSHFPDDKDWQLLTNPINLSEYQEMVRLWPLYYKLKLQLNSHKKGVINAPEDGVVEVKIKSSTFSRADATFKCGLTTKDRKRVVVNVELERQVFHYADGDNEVFLVHIPAPGEYLFKIFGLSQKYSEEGVYTNICLYQINSKKIKPRQLKIKHPQKITPSDLVAPFPVVPNQWGPTESARVGVQAISHKQAIVCCDENGEATITWQIQPGYESSNFTGQVLQMNGEILSNRCIQYKVKERGADYVKFCTRVPQQGFFGLKLFQKASSSVKDVYSEFCSYVLASFSQKCAGQLFPAVANGDIGVITEEFEKVFISSTISIIDGKSFDSKLTDGSCWLTCPHGSVAAFTFKHTRGTTVLATLEASSGENVKKFVSVFSAPTSTIVTVQPPPANAPEVLLNVFGAELGVSSGIPNVYKGFINTAKMYEPIIPSPPSQSWGLTSNFYEFEMEVVDWKYPSMFGATAPCAGSIQPTGEDFQFTIKSKHPMNYLEKVFYLEGDNWIQQNENSSFLYSQENDVTSFKIRFSREGFYYVAVYGALKSVNGKQLKPLLYNLIKVNKKSSSQDPLPKSYALWNSNNVELLLPTTGTLKANVENNIQIRISKSNTNAFPKVVLMTGGGTAVYPTSVDASINLYTWNYLPGPGENNINLVVQPNDGDDSLNYALQFSIVD